MRMSGMAVKNIKRKIVRDIFDDGKHVVRVRNVTRSGDLYFISRSVHGDVFRLWHFLDNNTGYELLSESDSPVNFDDLIPWDA